jgi:hypothetical protein
VFFAAAEFDPEYRTEFLFGPEFTVSFRVTTVLLMK